MKLTGDRNQCRGPGCGEFFNSTAAFDMHRTGKPRRCMSSDEMTAALMLKNAEGFWITGLMPKSAYKQAPESISRPLRERATGESVTPWWGSGVEAPIPCRTANALGEVESMKRCPKFDSCSATLCPLDPKWQQRYLTKNDRVCTWLLEMAKAGPGAQTVPDAIRDEIGAIVPHLVASDETGALNRRMHEASLTPSRRAPEATARLRSL